MFRDQGYEAQQQGDVQAAIRYYQQAIQADPSYVSSYNDLGVIYETLGQPDQAKEAYRACLKANPSYPGAYANLAALYESQGDMMSAASYWKRRAQLGPPDDPWTQKARRRWEELSRGNPWVAQTKPPSPGSATREQGPPQGRELSRKAETPSPDVPATPPLKEAVQDLTRTVQELTHKTRTTEQLQQELDASRKGLERVERQREDAVEQLQRERAIAQRQLGELNGANAALEARVQELTQVHHRGLRQLEAQLASLQNTVQEEQAKAATHRNDVERLTRDKTALEAEVQELALVEQEHASLQTELGETRKALHTLTQAKAALETQVQGLTQVQQEKARLEQELAALHKQSQAALTTLHKTLQEEQAKMAAQRNEVQTVSRANAALETRVREMTPAHQQKQQLEQQLAELTKTTQRQQATLYHELGVAYTQLQAYAKAIGAFEEALRLNPDNPQTHYHLGLLYKQARKDLQKASHHLRTYLQMNPQASDRKQLEVLLTLMQRERPQPPAP